MKNKLVAIVLCTFNGENFIKHQLNSILQQSYSDIDLFISDDGSTDSTLEIIDTFIRENNLSNIYLFDGPKKGFAKNFISTLFKIRNLKEKNYSYFAFSDQDDVWEKDKIKNALKILEQLPKDRAQLYCSRTYYVDLKSKIIGASPLFKRKPSFKNALV